MESDTTLELKAKGMPTRDELNLIGKNAHLTSKSCDSVGVQIRNSRNTVAFKTPGVVKKTPCV
jgi:hypothetical protein